MRIITLDLETDLFGPGNMDPRPVCMSWTWDGEVGHLCTEDEIEAHLSEWLSDRDIRFLGQNVAYDFGCLYRWYPALRALIWSAYDRFAVVDTQIHERLIHIQAGTDGKESLAHLAKQYLDVDLDKTTHRLSYGSLRGRPISAWPDGAARYAIDDALMTRRVWECQRREGVSTEEIARQTRHAWALHNLSLAGIRTDRATLDETAARIAVQQDEDELTLCAAGLLGYDKKTGKPRRNLKKAQQLIEQIAAERGIEAVRTDKDRIATAEADLAWCDHPAIRAFARYSTAQSRLSMLDALGAGVERPIHTRFRTPIKTGRVSSSAPNLQNIPRMPGFREAAVPRNPGWLFAQADYSSLELHTLAQACRLLVGYSKLGDALNRKEDVHLRIGAATKGIAYEDALPRKKEPEFKALRNLGKVANFGFGGGLGAAKMVDYARDSYGVIMTEDQARELKEVWLDTFDELRHYFRHIDGLLKDVYWDEEQEREVRTGSVRHLYTDRIRGGCYYTEAANSYFQGLASDGAKEALYEVVRECKIGTGPLAGCIPVLMIHDEILLETPPETAHEAALELQRIMETEMARWIPDYPTTAPPALMSRWYKNAEAVYDADGRLVPWQPEKK